MLALAPAAPWTPPIVQTVATTGEGVERLWEAISAHRAHLVDTGDLERRRRERVRNEIRELVKAHLAPPRGGVLSRPRFEAIVDEQTRGAFDPQRVAEQVVAEALSEAMSPMTLCSAGAHERRSPLGEHSRDGGRRGEALRRCRGGRRRRSTHELRRARRRLPPGDGCAAGVRASSEASASRSGRPTDTNGWSPRSAALGAGAAIVPVNTRFKAQGGEPHPRAQRRARGRSPSASSWA